MLAFVPWWECKHIGPDDCHLHDAAVDQHAGAAHFTAHASGLSVPHGLAILASAPVFSELSTWSDWDLLYSPVLGPLPAFISKHQQQLGFRALEVPGGGLLKLPAVEGNLDLQQLRAGLKQALEQVWYYNTV